MTAPTMDEMLKPFMKLVQDNRDERRVRDEREKNTQIIALKLALQARDQTSSRVLNYNKSGNSDTDVRGPVCGWSVATTVDFLRGLDFDSYAEHFEEMKYNGAALLQVTELEVREMPETLPLTCKRRGFLAQIKLLKLK